MTNEPLPYLLLHLQHSVSGTTKSNFSANPTFTSTTPGTSTKTTNVTNSFTASAGLKASSGTDPVSNFPGFNSTNASASIVSTNQSTVTSGPPSTGPVFGLSSGAGFRSGSSTPTHGHRKSPTSDHGNQVGNSYSHKDDRHGGMNSYMNRDRQQGYRDQRDNRQPRQFNNDRRWQQRRPGPPPGPMQRAPQGYRGRPNQGPQEPQRRPMWSRAAPQPRAPNRGGSMNRGSKPDQIRKVYEEYDFEKANQEFQELENKLANMKVDGDKEVPEPVPEEPVAENPKKDDDEENVFYDKTKSFFDKISCEALERSKG